MKQKFKEKDACCVMVCVCVSFFPLAPSLAGVACIINKEGGCPGLRLTAVIVRGHPQARLPGVSHSLAAEELGVCVFAFPAF